ncbi:MAG: hypothetical protein U0350_35030 [Caldilineaceae bacterium]
MKRWTIQWQPPPLYFMHIHKTTGVALGNWLTTVYGSAQVGHIHLHLLHETDPDQLGQYRCWQSHFGPGLLPYLPVSNLQIITMLRDPVEQVVSHIYFIRKRLVTLPPERFDPDYLAAMRPLHEADLATWLAHPNSTFFDNFQTRSLGTYQDLALWFKTSQRGQLRQTTPFPLLPARLTDECDMQQLFQAACRQLEQAAVVGITEYFAESLVLISGLLGVSPPKQTPAANLGSEKRKVRVNAYRQQTSPDLIDTIEERNRYDCELYRYGSALFAEQYARQQADPQRSYSIAPRLRHYVQQMVPLVARRIKAVTPQRVQQSKLRRVYQFVHRRLA